MSRIFQLEPLTQYEWVWVLYFSVPVIFLDEILKFVARVSGHGKTVKVA